MIRPQPARWFEIVAARDDAFLALEALAAAGCVEVEWHETDRLPGASGAAEAQMKRIEALARKYRPYWPEAAARLPAERRSPVDALAAAASAIDAWAVDAEPMVGKLQQIGAEHGELALTAQALREFAASRLDFSALASASGGVAAAVFALPLDAEVDLPPTALTRVATLTSERLVLAVAPPAVLEAAAHGVIEAGGRRGRFPDWLQPTAEANLVEVAQRLAALADERRRLQLELREHCDRHHLADALATVARTAWCFEHGAAIGVGDVFARITGWTVAPERVVEAIEHCGARAVVAFPAPPRGIRPPLVLRNPWWAQPFEVFTRLVGMPGSSGADPSALLAFAVPLMFGYMFGDVGQGLVLALAGWLLRDRLPVLRLLVPGGLAAAAFGLVFGSVFSVEGWIHPLWVAPLDQPLLVLLIPIAGGALLLVLGLALGALEAWWEGLFDRWLRTDGPALLGYVGLAAVVIEPMVGVIAISAAIAWAVLAGVAETRSAAGAGTALGEWIERSVQLAINTLSFARVGAFALAHAGLSSAVVALADAAASPIVAGLVLVLGNALIVLIEGLVVSIQTTRLVLFEFFTRFFRSEGREFRPLATPPVVTEES